MTTLTLGNCQRLQQRTAPWFPETIGSSFKKLERVPDSARKRLEQTELQGP